MKMWRHWKRLVAISICGSGMVYSYPCGLLRKILERLSLGLDLVSQTRHL